MIPLGLVRALLGLLALFVAYLSGRSAARLFERRERLSRTIAWVVRVALAIGAIVWFGGLDVLARIVLVLAAAAAGSGAWRQLHPPPPEDLSRQIFPNE